MPRPFWFTTLVLAAVFSGCGPQVPRSELGEVLWEVPKVAGSEEPYDLGKIRPAPSRAAEERADGLTQRE